MGTRSLLRKKNVVDGKDKKTEKGVETTKEKPKDNKIEKKELMKRLALEKLRKDKKFADKKTAPRNDPLAAIGEQLKKNSKGKTGTQKAAELKYGLYLKKKINQQYYLPQTFTPTVSNPVVILEMVVNTEGNLRVVKVHKSSKDTVFDEYTIAAAKNAAPFERPPATLAGRTILVNFPFPR